jgi:colanic acid/amylovoran biosynthesis glycosyltransferase
LKIVYVTANLPHGTDEAFIMPEIGQLTEAGHDVLVVPRSPHGLILHGHELLRQSRQEGLYSTQVLRSAATAMRVAPSRTIAAARPLLKSRSTPHFLKNLAIIPKAMWLADVATQWKADHIHCHWAGTTATMAMLASNISGIPWSLTLHRWDIVENNLLAEKVKNASFARFICQDGLRMARTIGIEPEANVRVLPMGVTIPSVVEKRPTRKPVVICPARFVRVKGHRFLLQAWRILKDHAVTGDLWLAGQGELRRELEELTDTFGLRSSVKFLGALPHRELLSLYQESVVSVVVVPSIDMGNGYHEGIPVALIEAMSYGLPVVATRTGGTDELVVPGTGWLVAPEDPAALASALQTLLEDTALREEMGNRGRLHVMEAHDIVRVAAQLANAFAAARSQPPRALRQYSRPLVEKTS